MDRLSVAQPNDMAGREETRIVRAEARVGVYFQQVQGFARKPEVNPGVIPAVQQPEYPDRDFIDLRQRFIVELARTARDRMLIGL